MPSDRSGRLVRAAAVAILLIVTGIVFSPCLNNGWTNWDDGDYVISNPDIQGLTIPHLARMFSSVYVSTYLPLTMVSFAAEYSVAGFDPFLFHATNLFFHLSNTFLVFVLIRRLTEKDPVAFGVALLFGIHPLHVESVAWISARKDVLSTFFFLLSLVAYEGWAEGRHRRARSARSLPALSVFFFLCALLSKALTVTLPVVILIMDYLKRRNLFSAAGVELMKRPFITAREVADYRKALRHLFPYMVLSTIVVVIGIIAQQSGSSLRLMQSPVDNVLVASHGVVFYINKLIVPTGLSFMYPYPEKVHGLLPVEYLMAPPILAAMGYVLYRWLRHDRTIMAGVFFFLITLAPVSQLIPMGSAVAADRYMYIPAIGLFLIVSDRIFRLYQRWKSRRVLWLSACGCLVVAVLVFYGLTSYRQCMTWKNNQTIIENFHKQ